MSRIATAVPVALEGRSYSVHVGHGVLGQLAEFVPALGRYSSFAVIADSAISDTLGQRVCDALALLAPSRLITIPSGEASKSFAQLEQLLENLLATQPDRRTCLVAVGGGMVGDLVGFTASMLLRGVDFIQIPTTLLAMVDSSVGGKTAINSAAGKNLIGAFYQPRLVLADLDALATLPAREMRAGYAEVVKYGALGDAAFFDWLQRNAAAALAGDGALLQQMVAHCVQAKATIVAADEREAGQRALLNLGHTLGHALEAACGYDGTLLHGESVAIGMVFAFRLAAQLGFATVDDTARLTQHLRAAGLPTHPHAIRPDWDSATLVQSCAGDKKAVSGKLTFVLPRALGTTEVVHPVAEQTVLACLTSWLSEGK